MKRLAIVTTHPIQYNAPLFKLLSERKNIEVKVFYTWEKGAEHFDQGFGRSFQWDIPLLEGYEYSFVSNNGNMGKGFWDVKNPNLIQSIKEWQPQAVLVYGWNYWSHLQVLRHFKGKIKVLFRGDSTLIGEKKGMKKLLRKWILKWIYSYVDYALYVGTNNKAYFQQHGLKEKQLIFVPHAIDNDRFSTENRAQTEYRENLMQSMRLKDDTNSILFAGKFQKKKNVALLLEAFKQLKLPSWKLILVGNGEDEEQLKQASAGHEDIYFLPFQNQMMIPAVYRLGKIFCLPSQGPEETWGLAVNEAMASGRAVIVSDEVGCAVDLVEDGVNGYIFQSGNLGDLMDKMTMAAGQDLLRMGNQSKLKIENWRFEVQAKQIEQLLTGTIG